MQLASENALTCTTILGHIILGPLFFFESVFPPKNAGTALEQSISLTLLKGNPMAGDIVSQGNLHTFFDSMMHFESAFAFSQFTKHGHSVVITVPTNVCTSNIIAACSFIFSTGSLFVDSIVWGWKVSAHLTIQICSYTMQNARCVPQNKPGIAGLLPTFRLPTILDITTLTVCRGSGRSYHDRQQTTLLLMYHPKDDAPAPSIAMVAPKKKRRGKKKKQMAKIIDNMADEPANELGPEVKFEFECTSQKRIEKVLELASSEAQDECNEGNEGAANDYNSYKHFFKFE
jgi:hypothetical protein